LYLKYINDKKGFGLFTGDTIPINTFICEYIGEVYESDSNSVYNKLNSSINEFKDYSMRVNENGKT
jgi:hypothetical protein